MLDRRMKILLAFAAIYLIWGSTYLAIRVAIETLPPFLMAGTRFVLAGLPFYLWLRWRGHAAPAREHWISATVLGSLMMFGGNGLVTWSEQFVPSSIAAVIITTVPLWMTLLDRIVYRSGPLGWTRLLGLGMGFVGVGILMAPTASEADRVNLIGGAALVFAALFWAIGSLHSRRARVPDSPLMAAAMQMTCGGAAMVLTGTLVGEWRRLDLGQVSGASVLAMGYLVVFGSIVALSAYVWLLRVVPASAVSTYAFVNPVVAVLLGWSLGGEHLGPRALIASALVVGAVGLILGARRAPQAEVCESRA